MFGVRLGGGLIVIIVIVVVVFIVTSMRVGVFGVIVM